MLATRRLTLVSTGRVFGLTLTPDNPGATRSPAGGAGGAGAGGAGGAGGALTVTGRVRVEVWPRVSTAVTVTWYVPGAAKVCDVVAPVAVSPSPNAHVRVGGPAQSTAKTDIATGLPAVAAAGTPRSVSRGPEVSRRRDWRREPALPHTTVASPEPSTATAGR